MTDPLVIGGSHLQALILAGVAATVAVAWRHDLVGWPPAIIPVLLLALGATAIAIRRCALTDEGVRFRRLGPTISAQRGHFHAELGHRYLTVHTDTGGRFRIEVPVEIRPEVRRWVESSRSP